MTTPHHTTPHHTTPHHTTPHHTTPHHTTPHHTTPHNSLYFFPLFFHAINPLERDKSNELLRWSLAILQTRFSNSDKESI
jgi:hypothetical protein